MNEKIRTLLSEAGKLPAPDQIELVERIMLNLPPDGVADAAWAELAERRLDGARAGEAETFDADEVLADLSKRLKAMRAGT
jgi:putative addiction module component (TIGR02574 family)